MTLIFTLFWIKCGVVQQHGVRYSCCLVFLVSVFNSFHNAVEFLNLTGQKVLLIYLQNSSSGFKVYTNAFAFAQYHFFSTILSKGSYATHHSTLIINRFKNVLLLNKYWKSVLRWSLTIEVDLLIIAGVSSVCAWYQLVKFPACQLSRCLLIWNLQIFCLINFKRYKKKKG